MLARWTNRFRRDFEAALTEIQKTFEKQLQLLLKNWRHPSLRAKCIDEMRRIYQARVTRDWRFYYHPEADTYYLLTIRRHPKDRLPQFS